ncbi:hypothetical protein Syun_003967 [Stephania yunnanensis]|uniref:Uncharacterized protein n=1 Tax=Stephania yunnanensis TaxID=152371 RepID=A0AAP0L4Q4_9MAGN
MFKSFPNQTKPKSTIKITLLSTTYLLNTNSKPQQQPKTPMTRPFFPAPPHCHFISQSASPALPNSYHPSPRIPSQLKPFTHIVHTKSLPKSSSIIHCSNQTKKYTTNFLINQQLHWFFSTTNPLSIGREREGRELEKGSTSRVERVVKVRGRRFLGFQR